MTLQTTGIISLADIQTEFGGSNPIGINEYYGVASGVPASGLISLQDFYGKSNAVSATTSGFPIDNTYLMLNGSSGSRGSASGSVTASGGTSPYTYVWAYVSGAFFSINNSTSSSTAFTWSGTAPAVGITDVHTGIYKVTVTDAASGTVVKSNLSVTFRITGIN